MRLSSVLEASKYHFSFRFVGLHLEQEKIAAAPTLLTLTLPMTLPAGGTSRNLVWSIGGGTVSSQLTAPDHLGHYRTGFQAQPPKTDAPKQSPFDYADYTPEIKFIQDLTLLERVLQTRAEIKVRFLPNDATLTDQTKIEAHLFSGEVKGTIRDYYFVIEFISVLRKHFVL